MRRGEWGEVNGELTSPSLRAISSVRRSPFGVQRLAGRVTGSIPLTSHLSPLTSHLSPLTSHLSPLTSPLSPLPSATRSRRIPSFA
jgi:hypothetical protein